MVFVFLTPQPNNYSEMLGIQVNIDLISTLNSISKGKNVATYQTCLDKLMIATYLVRGKVQVILSNGEMKEVTDEDTLEDIMELEKSAIEEAFNTPTIDLKAKTNINEIKVNAMDFYQAIYCDDNADTIEDSMVEAIKQTKTEEVGVEVSNELDIVNKIIEDYEVEGKISEIECNGTLVPNDEQDDFLRYLKRIIMEGFTVPLWAVEFKDTKNLNYVILFDSGDKIIRKAMEFSIE